MERDLEAIKRKIAPVLKRHHVVRAAIFGSFVRGEARESSDIDVLVELEGDKSLLDLVALKLDLEDTLGGEVDVVEYSTVHPRLRDEILREQVPVI